jgi:hypothetical protein
MSDASVRLRNDLSRPRMPEELMSVYLVQKLRARHHQLEREIDGELKNPLPDPYFIAEAKREKLMVKDRIVKAMREEQFAQAH